MTSPSAAAELLRASFGAVDTERRPLSEASGLILGEDVRADRDSPACDVSVMDGFAFAVADHARTLPVQATTAAGAPPIDLERGAAVKVFTGAPIPHGADVVVRREAVAEGATEITFLDATPPRPGDFIRRQGENGGAGAVVCERGRVITPGVIGALAAFGYPSVTVHRRVRVTILNTGDELRRPDEATIPPWQLRNSNGPLLEALLRATPWLEVVAITSAVDESEALRAAVGALLARSDALVLTGGVSAGDLDLVPSVLDACGVETLFHRLAMRPGHPTLGGRGPDGQVVLGLPGNPVAAALGGVRLLGPALRVRAGATGEAPRPGVLLADPASAGVGDWTLRLATIAAAGTAGTAALVPNRGSGDLVALSRADGFVEVPPDTGGTGPFPFYDWAL